MYSSCTISPLFIYQRPSYFYSKKPTMSKNAQVIIQCNKKDFKISRKATEIVESISHALEGIKDEDLKDNPVPVRDVAIPILEKIITFLDHYQTHKLPDINKPIGSGDFKSVVGDFYGKFVESMDDDTLFDMINAANQMAIQPLVDLLCAQAACKIYGKKKTDITLQFGHDLDSTFVEGKDKKFETYPDAKNIRARLQAKLTESNAAAPPAVANADE